MKNIFVIIFVLTLMIAKNFASDKIDVNKKPDALTQKEFVFPKYSEVKLKNGLKVFIVEDHEQPTISFRLLIAGGISMDNTVGTSELLSDLITKGAAKRTALDIAQSLDGVGASINANAGADNITIFANGLKKHMPLILDILSDIILKPTFPEDEFAKSQKQMQAGIQYSKSDPSKIAGDLAKMVIYGEKHPYGIKTTEESVKAVKINDIKEFYKTYFLPNNSSLIVVGDVKKEEIVSKLEKAFDKWKEGNKPEIRLPATAPLPVGVYFVSRPGSVQSSVVVTTPGVPYVDPDYEQLDLASNVMGGGFGGRLFRTLREKYSYTYTPFAYLTQAKYSNRFSCGADVRSTVTDSSIEVILNQLTLLTTDFPTDEEINRIKKHKIGQYLMNFESSSFIASLLQNADFMGISIQTVKDYPTRINSLGPMDVKQVARKYMKPISASIIVVGSPEVKSSLEKFGKIYEYDLDLNPISGEKAKLEKVNLSPAELIKKYTDAIGGKDALSKTTTVIIKSKASLSIQGQNIEGTVTQKFKAQNKKLTLAEFPVFKQGIWTNGDSSWSMNNNAFSSLKGEDLKKANEGSIIFRETRFLELGYKCEIKGKLGNEIIMKVVSPGGIEATYYYDAQTFLMTKMESIEKTPQGAMPVTEVYSDYKKVDNLMFAGKSVNSNPFYTMTVINEYQLNQPLDDNEFIPPKN